MRKLASLALSLFLLTGTAFADSPKDTPKDSPKDAPKEAAATPAKPAAANALTKTNAELAAQMEELRQALQAQQEQLQMLKEELSKRDRQIEEAREAAASANARASEANTKAVEAVTTSAEVKSTATALNSTVTTMAASNAAVVNSAVGTTSGQQTGSEEKGPMTIRFKGINITPGGFIEAATVNRQRSESADINSQFNGIPYPGNSLSKVSEMNFSARQSRLTLLLESKVGTAKVTGYFESDFLGAGTTSNNRESNSYVFRMRQGWGQAAFDNGWAFTAGQMWTLATENKKGIMNRGEALPLMIDPQYLVGFTWERIPSVRVTKSFGDKLTLGVSAEEPQTTIGGRGFSAVTTSVSGTAAATTSQNFFFNAPGNSAGLYNAFDPTGYTVNKIPDFVIKAAFDPGWGHYEILGIVSDFRARVYPCAVLSPTASNAAGTVILKGNPITSPFCSSAGALLTAPSAAFAYNDSKTGGGFGVSAAVPLFAKKLDASLKGVYGTGIGRFGSSQLADVTARPDGTLASIHNAQWLGRLEWHVTPKFDLYGYLGGEYASRAAYTGYSSVKIVTTPAIPLTSTSPAIPATTTYTTATNGIGGYGSPLANNTGCSTETVPAGTGTPGTGGTCAGDTRYVGEGTLGFWHKLYQGEKGRVQWGVTYSYVYRVGWSGSGGVAAGAPAIAPKAIDNMVWTSFRYYLP
ncbi:MAG TPA: hypothetical protein VG075_09020 [Candidatus Acidoferrum sp.]|jgi:hypothetical protein|nr:hypothetical protein [Candidatus Acidoferrum sp.]